MGLAQSGSWGEVVRLGIELVSQSLGGLELGILVVWLGLESGGQTVRLGVAQLERLGEVELRLLVVQLELESGGQAVPWLGVALSEGLKRLQLDLLRSGSRRELEDVKAASSQLVNSHTNCAKGMGG